MIHLVLNLSPLARSLKRHVVGFVLYFVPLLVRMLCFISLAYENMHRDRVPLDSAMQNFATSVLLDI